MKGSNLTYFYLIKGMRLDQGIVKASPVRLVKEDILATVPAQHYVSSQRLDSERALFMPSRQHNKYLKPEPDRRFPYSALSFTHQTFLDLIDRTLFTPGKQRPLIHLRTNGRAQQYRAVHQEEV